VISRRSRRRIGIVVAALSALFLFTGARFRLHREQPRPLRTSRTQRNLELVRLGADVGGAYATTAARKVFASAARRTELDRERELRTAEAVAERLGQMKGALMKLGQMASYVDEALPPAMRAALAELRSDAPPMSADLAAQVVERELGAPPERCFVEWDPIPLAAASIGQVHRAIAVDPATGRERAVAVKVQYPGVGDAIASDLGNADLLGALLQQGFGGLDPKEMVAEIRARLTEELDYRREAVNQQLFADRYRGHPTIHVPDVIPDLSTGRVLTSELVTGSTWDELLTWDQAERDVAGETLFRFVFRSLYGMHAFNGDPHPGNYLFHGGGRVTFLDFGLVKHFSDEEMATFVGMVQAAAYDHDMIRFREIVEGAGMLRRGAPVDDAAVGEYFGEFYAPVRTDHVITWSGEFASRIVRHTFDRSSPIAQYATVPRAFVFIQRINLGLYALLGELGATWSRWGERLIPIATLYDPFVPRALEPWSYGIYAGGQSILVGTPSGVTLAPEGGAHQSITTPSIGLEQPGCTAWEPAFPQDLEWCFLHAMGQVGVEGGTSSYFRLSTRPVDPALAAVPEDEYLLERRRQQVVAGGYRLPAPHPSREEEVTLVGVGAIMPEVLAAAAVLAAEGVNAGVVCLTSPDLVFRSFQQRSRRTSGVGSAILDQLLPAERPTPLVTVLDGHPHTLSFLAGARGDRIHCLGVTEFGQSSDLVDAYRLHEIDTGAIVDAALGLLGT